MSTTAGVDPLRILLVDDQHLVRSGFRMMLSVEPGFEVVGEAGDGMAAIDAACTLRPDVVLMDVEMPVLDGVAATRAIATEQMAKVLILTTFDRDDYLFAALDAGASGFLLKNTSPEHLVEAIRIVHEGHALLAPEVTRRVIEQRLTGVPDGPSVTDPSRADAPVNPAIATAIEWLTEREREVLTLVGRGLTNAEIAATLFVGEATVKTHVSNCFAKLHLRDRVQAVIVAYEAGLVGTGD